MLTLRITYEGKRAELIITEEKSEGKLTWLHVDRKKQDEGEDKEDQSEGVIGLRLK